MHFFADYFQPLITWIYANPHWALLITFLISFTESLAIIGSIIPGSVTMTAIGILAGSGAMRIDLTLFAATLGAIAGDSASYALGFTFRTRLPHIWPFSRYPHWLEYGKTYFAKHGGKSVLIGRFVGPLRSIIPVIAGMMHMNRWYFLIVNVISAIGWSILYVMPGVLIGAASSELSAERASQLFFLVLLILASMWFLWTGLRWLFAKLNLYIRTHFHRLGLWSKKHPKLAFYFKQFIPKGETNHYPTIAVLILFLLFLLLSLILTLLVLQTDWINSINTASYLFLQSIRTSVFEQFFIIISLFIHPFVLALFGVSFSVYLIFCNQLRALKFWLSMIATTFIVAFVLARLVVVPSPTALMQTQPYMHFPDIYLTLATGMFSFLMLYVSTYFTSVVTLIVRILLTFIIFLSAIGILYLGDNWLLSVVGAFAIGLTICLGYWIFFRRHIINKSHRRHLPILVFYVSILMAFSLSIHLFFNSVFEGHKPYYKQYVLTKKAWWNQKAPVLPIHIKNRIGQTVGLFNVQYVGSLETLEQALLSQGWEKQTDSFLHDLISRISNPKSMKNRPLMAQLYHNRKPIYIATLKDASIYEIRLWRSNYHLKDIPYPIWIGSLYKVMTQEDHYNFNILSFEKEIQVMEDFEHKIISLPHDKQKIKQPATILLIQDRTWMKQSTD